MNLSVRKKEIMTGLFCILFFVGGAVAGEIALRIVSLSKFGMTTELAVAVDKKQAQPEKNSFFKDSDSGLRLPYPNQQMGQVRINNFGFRGPDIEQQKAEKIIRIAFLGSSTTYDANVSKTDNWPNQTATKFQQRLQGCTSDYINAGLPGYSTQHMRKYWHSKVSQFAVDVVILLPGDMTNDIQSAAKKAGFSGHKTNKSWLSTHSLLWQKIEKNAAIIRAQRAAFNEAGKFTPDIEELTRKFEQRLNQAIDTLQADNLHLALATISSHVRPELTQQEQIKAADSALYFMPYLSIPTLLQAQDQYNQSIRKVAEQRNIHLIENENSIPANEQHFVDSRHFNTAGSRLMADRVIEGLLANADFIQHIKIHVPACQLSQ